MGYRIEYDGGTVKRQDHRVNRRIRKPLLLGVFSVLVALALCWTPVRREIRDILLPGDPEVTAAALGGLVEDLHSGEPISDALHTFCVEILAGDA